MEAQTIQQEPVSPLAKRIKAEIKGSKTWIKNPIS
jgi:hypothetical protein